MRGKPLEDSESRREHLSRRRLLLGLCVSAAGIAVGVRPVQAAENVVSAAEALAALRESDRYRGGLAEGARWDLSLESRQSDGRVTAHYLVKAKGSKALVECTAPAKNRNELTLFEEYALWFYKPGLRRPVALSARQRLIGQAANGDIAATNYARDYEIVSASNVDYEGDAAWLLQLRAKAKQVTYDGIRYWVRKKDRLGVKAEFLTVQGEVFKRATFSYNNQISVRGKRYPFVSEMVIVNASFSTEVTVLTYESPTVQNVSDSEFNVNNFLR